MALAEQISDIYDKLHEIAQGLRDGVVEIKDANNKLRYDIEPKLDQALEGKASPAEAAKLTPDQMLHRIRLCIVYVKSRRKIEAVKLLREITGASIQEAKTTAEWMEDFVKMEEKEAE